MGFNGNLMTLMGKRGGSYASRIKSLFGSSLIGYWKMDETSGETAVDSSPQGNNGAYTGVTLANTAMPAAIGGSAPYFDGANDSLNVQSAGFASDFIGTTGSVILFAKMFNAGVWTDGTLRVLFTFLANNSNYVQIYKDSSSNQLNFRYKAGNINEDVAHGSFSPTTWFVPAITWDKTADGMKAYINGSQVGTTQTIAGTFTGSLTSSVLGANSTTPDYVTNGWVGHAMVLNRAATPAETLTVAQWAGLA